ncbi:class I SAM-dependent methyltransferase [Nostoc sp.]|uniref:class I SAM-dependent methyltransferase n=1 Tax=Nostoc sp. TaxID=1180 RepID=UPI002FF7DB4F
MTETKVRKQYDRLAAIYDQRWSNYIANTLSFLKSWAQISPSDVVLDIACGTGEFERLILIEQPMQQMVGVDISDKMLLMAKQKCCNYPNVSFYNAPASVLPFASNSFDVVISASSFHYFDEPDAALAEMKRVLKPDGKLVILDWCRDYLLCQICDIILKVFDPAYKQCYSQAEFHQLLTSAGFNICRANKVRFGLIWGLMVATASC